MPSWKVLALVLLLGSIFLNHVFRTMGCGSSSASTGAVADSSQNSLTPGSNKLQTNQLEIPGYYDGYSNGVQPRNSIAEDPGGTLSGPRSSISMVEPLEVEEKERKLQYICDTDVSLEWLYQRLTEKFKCQDEPEPQWIAERLNTVGDKGECFYIVCNLINYYMESLYFALWFKKWFHFYIHVYLQQ